MAANGKKKGARSIYAPGPKGRGLMRILEPANRRFSSFVSPHLTSFPMKNTLLALVLFAFAGTTAFAQEGPAKDSKKAIASTGTKASCTMKGGMAGGSCCMKGGKTASVKPAAKPEAAVKL